MAKLISIVTILLILSGCMPMGYIQSPRVLPGVSLGPSGGVLIPQRLNEIKTVYTDSMRDYNSSVFEETPKTLDTCVTELSGPTVFGGSWFTYPRVGIADRVRISGSVFVIPLPSTYSGGSIETMVNIIDRGEPVLFRNIAVGAVTSAYYLSSEPEYNAYKSYISFSAGGLAGTHKKLSRHGGELELVFGAGLTKTDYQNGAGFIAYGSSYDSSHIVSQKASSLLIDASPSVHISFSERRRLLLSAGCVVSPVLFTKQQRETLPANLLYFTETPVKRNAEFRGQISLSYRLGGKRGQARIDARKSGAPAI